MSERLVARIIIGLSVLLIVSEIVVIALYGIRFEVVFLPFVVFLAFLGVLFGAVLLKGKRSEIESVSTRRARAMKDEKVRKLLEGYEVDEEFLPGGGKKKNKRQQKQRTAAPETSESYSRSPVSEPRRDPFEGIDSKLYNLAEGFGGFEQMVQKVEAMDTVAFKRLQYALDMQGIDKSQLLQPVKKALDKVSGGSSGLRQLLDHEEMDAYMEQTLTGRKPDGDKAGQTYSLDINMDDAGGKMPPPPDEFSHNPRDVIDRFKKSLNKK
ncbi:MULTISPECIES: hypothetical protein [Prosthecochloris]|uniref:Uncharacterized protein n=1 Tax=Prosthecochloris marina TaxID=2017681 RepID=A0A317T975_9CHLB|nr:MULTISPECIES: hypothetical protein [Prosthecochloris]PWW82287.1 hypothetical protein CR164_04565 [Prosthecochloris marina]UZJ37249.1 hypothetical protein OO005_10915 [Prosthecochloris sp. SCSIO W1103]UZJ39062.1 hypothetical protein OO185_03760 [Prosthecochloris sp. SCSIO W1102]